MDALTMLLFALFSTPIALVTQNPHFREHEGLVSGMMSLVEGRETTVLSLEGPDCSFGEAPVAR